MRKFLELVEQKGAVVFTFGRFNPPTTGHEKLIQKVASVAGSNPFRIYPSQSQNQKKDPLPFALKIAYMRRMFPKYARNIRAEKNARTAIEIAVKLHDEGFTDLIMVVGSDRVKEFSTLLKAYNGVEGKRHGFYKFNTIDVVSAGERDPDAEGVSGMSASKMRAAASNSDFDSFEQGLPSGFRDGKKLYLDVRKYMGIREQRDMGEMSDFETLRDMYLTGEIWNIDDLIEANGVEGRIIRRGTNYVAFNDKDGKVHKAWLHEIKREEVEEQKKIRKVKQAKGEVGDVKGTQPAKYYAKGAGGKGMAKSTAVSRARFFAKGADKPDDDPDSYKPAPGDKGKKTRPSQYTKKFKQMYGEVQSELEERNYASEYKNYHSRPEQIARRSSRNKARRIMGDKVIKGMDVGHIDNNPMNNDIENLRNEDPSDNRREPRLRDEKFDSDKFFSGKGTPEQRLQLLKLTNKALRTLGGSPKQKAIQKEIDALRKKMGMKVKEEVELNELPSSFMGKLISKMDDIIHPKGYDKLVKRYVELMKQDRMTTGRALLDAIRSVKNPPSLRSLQAYINKLVTKGTLPKELKAEVEVDELLGFARKTPKRTVVKRKNLEPDSKSLQQKIKDKQKEYKLKRLRDFVEELKKVEEGIGEPNILSQSVKQKEQIKSYVRDIARAMRDKGHENLKKFADNFEKDALKSLDPEKELRKIPNIKRGEIANLLNMSYTESLWANIHKKRQRIKRGSGERMRKKGEKGAPTAAQMKRAKGEEVELGEKAPNTSDAMKRYKAGKAGFTDKAHLKAKGLIPRADGTKKKSPKYETPQLTNAWGEIEEAAEYDGRPVKLNNPTRGDTKKYKVYVKNEKGNVVKVEFGDPNMEIKRDDPARRRNFRARHNCDNPGPKYKARYWSCKFWSAKSVTDLMKG